MVAPVSLSDTAKQRTFGNDGNGRVNGLLELKE
jgi:hypothetical protein